jgi:orotidine-5'-phosphate decarboxylase
VEEARRLFGPVIHNVLPSSSRQILAAGPDRSALRAAAQQLTDQFAALRDPGPEGALRADRFGD